MCVAKAVRVACPKCDKWQWWYPATAEWGLVCDEPNSRGLCNYVFLPKLRRCPVCERVPFWNHMRFKCSWAWFRLSQWWLLRPYRKRWRVR